MTITTTYYVNVHFGDCDPAGIVFYPNFHKWMDAASLNFFMHCGIPKWSEYEKSSGIVGTPLLEISTKFIRPATYGETLEIETSVVEWRDKVVIQRHVVKRDGVVLCEGTETRAFVARHPDDPSRLKAVSIPQEVLDKCR